MMVVHATRSWSLNVNAVCTMLWVMQLWERNCGNAIVGGREVPPTAHLLTLKKHTPYPPLGCQVTSPSLFPYIFRQPVFTLE